MIKVLAKLKTAVLVFCLSTKCNRKLMVKNVSMQSVVISYLRFHILWKLKCIIFKTSGITGFYLLFIIFWFYKYILYIYI